MVPPGIEEWMVGMSNRGLKGGGLLSKKGQHSGGISVVVAIRMRIEVFCDQLKIVISLRLLRFQLENANPLDGKHEGC